MVLTSKTVNYIDFLLLPFASEDKNSVNVLSLKCQPKEDCKPPVWPPSLNEKFRLLAQVDLKGKYVV